ncbi:hypothetical protein HDU97_002021 [Phlyctochytrium planicorne]|nr:hypothetical protein HDU97_002021 [Phlyctochytrium planicorne]
MGNSAGKQQQEDYEVDLRQFNLLRCVGKGAFGKVRIVEKRDTRKLFALKYINKQQCVRMRAIQNIFRERAILEEISHPYIVNLRYAFQDDDNMFMVLDLMMGGDLRYHLDRIGGFREDAVRCMAVELASAVNYLHKNKIVHRDLKPDNILLDEAGHVHLTDFNIAVKYAGRGALKSHSGTLAYMAPEIFGDSGYLWQVDWWSLGVCLYECLYGKRPFRGNSNEALTQAIRKQTLNLPDANFVTRQPVSLSQECLLFLRGLLERNVERRLGSAGFETIKRHPFLAVFDWERVDRKDIMPVFVPEPNRSNFDASYDLEELLLEDNPLKYKPRKKKPVAKTTVAATSTSPTSPSTEATKSTKSFGRRKAGSQGAGFSVPMFDPRAMGRNRSVGGGLQGGAQASATGAQQGPQTGGGVVDRTTAELQFIEENFRTYDYTLAARAARAAAAAAAANGAAAGPDANGKERQHSLNGVGSVESLPPIPNMYIDGSGNGTGGAGVGVDMVRSGGGRSATTSGGGMGAGSPPKIYPNGTSMGHQAHPSWSSDLGQQQQQQQQQQQFQMQTSSSNGLPPPIVHTTTTMTSGAASALPPHASLPITTPNSGPQQPQAQQQQQLPTPPPSPATFAFNPHQRTRVSTDRLKQQQAVGVAPALPITMPALSERGKMGLASPTVQGQPMLSPPVMAHSPSAPASVSTAHVGSVGSIGQQQQQQQQSSSKFVGWGSPQQQ